ncbi:unnamed protein product [Ectocarpus sp. CCAP 1310/34]|nr:unnamed protein product [Ectocarpus sp. CCAP 1310/34]
MQNPLFLQQPNGGGDSNAEVATSNDDSGRRRRRPGTRGNGILQPGGVGTSSSSHGSAERGRRPRGEALAAIGEGRGQAERVCSDDDGGGAAAAAAVAARTLGRDRSDGARQEGTAAATAVAAAAAVGERRLGPDRSNAFDQEGTAAATATAAAAATATAAAAAAATATATATATAAGVVAVRGLGPDKSNGEGSKPAADRAGAPSTARGIEPPVQGCGVMTSTTFLKLVTVLAMAYFGVKLWTLHYDPASGRLCTFHDRHACVTSALSKVLLTVSRMSAGALLPSMACCILSKCYATRYFLHHSWLAVVVSFEPAHELHTFFGSLTLLFGVLHGLAHLAREVNEGNWNFFASPMGRSGFVALVLLFPIAVPMLLGRPKKLMTFEFRKALHMLFIPFMVAMCFHGKVLAVLAGILVAWYLVDRTYFTTRMHFCIERAVFRPVGRATLVRFDLPPGYQFNVGSYIQVNCPAISAKEWHPFSMFPVPGPRPRGGFYVEAVGDWTQELFRLSLEDPCMPLWITAAQPSVLEKSVYFENGEGAGHPAFPRSKMPTWL